MFEKLKCLFNKSTKNTPPKPKEQDPYDLLSSAEKKLYREFYDKHYESANDWYEKFEDEIYEIEDAYSDEFDYAKRISILNKAVKAYEKLYNKFSKYGAGGALFLVVEFPQLTKEYIPTQFCREYPVDFENINCIRWLLQYYTDHKDEVTKVLEDEYIDYNYGSREAYEEEMQIEQHRKDVRKKIIDLIKKNDGILQKDTYGEFDPDDEYLVKSLLKDLSSDGTIMRTKSGSTYSLHFNK